MPGDGQVNLYVGIKAEVATLEKMLTPAQLKAFFEGIGKVVAVTTKSSETKGAEPCRVTP